jgi:hypothetical protein
VDAGHGNGVVFDALDMGVLRLREMDIDVTSSLLACRAEALSSGVVVEADADVECLLIHGEQDKGPVLVGAGLQQLKCWRSVLLSDNASDRELAHARSLQDVPCDSVGLRELGDGGSADRHGGQAC